MSEQYLRNLSLVVSDPSGQGLELGEFRVVFTVRRGDIETPNSADIRVYNLANSTANTIAREFTQLTLAASYGDAPPALIFRGAIKQVRKGREDQLNDYVDITAADGDEAYNFSALASTLVASSATPDNMVQRVIKAMATPAIASANSGSGQLTPPVVLADVTAQLPANALPRGRTFYGACRDEMRDIAAANNCKWSIQDGEVVLIPTTGYLPGAIVVLSPTTGLIGVPEQTQNGLSARVLLNPAIKIGQRVQVNSAINQYRYGVSLTSQILNQKLVLGATQTQADGMYYVMRVDHAGDTRGENWYSDLTCLSVDATLPPDQALIPVPLITFRSPNDPVPLF